MKSNNKGFTLVEIIVAIAIGSIVLLIVGQLIVSSSLFMGTSVRTDEYKRKTDQIVSLVRDEIQYATDVRFVKEDSQYAPEYDKDANWHYLYVKDGMLYRDGKKLLSDGYYESETISIYIRAYKDNSHRMDVRYSLLDSNKEKLYGLKDTVMLLNLSLSSEMANKAFITNTNEYELSNNGYWLYYIKKVNDVGTDDPVTPNPDISGTVGDEIRCKNDSNTTTWENGKNDYLKGQFILYEGHWYRAIRNHNNSSKPDDNNHGNWKLIEPYWSDDSSYLRGDVVIASKNSSDYYKCTKSYDGDYKPNVEISNTNYWRKLSIAEIEAVKNEHNNPSFCNSKLCASSKLKTVKDELCEMDTIPSLPKLANSSVQNFGNNKGDWLYNSNLENLADRDQRLYYKGDFVKFDNAIWRCVSAYTDLSVSHEPSVGHLWKKIQIEYDEYSIYENGDVVLYTVNKKYYLSINAANVWKPTKTDQWVEVVPNSTGDGWIKVN